MLGEQTREEPLFYFLRVDELIRPDHILRLIDRYVDFAFIRPKVKPLYSHTGRPSVDPEVMLRMLLVGYLFGITSERRLCDEVQMHLGYRWFVGLSLHDPVPDHSTFSKNRHGRFQESGVYQEMFAAYPPCRRVEGTHRGFPLRRSSSSRISKDYDSVTYPCSGHTIAWEPAAHSGFSTLAAVRPGA